MAGISVGGSSMSNRKVLFAIMTNKEPFWAPGHTEVRNNIQCASVQYEP